MFRRLVPAMVLFAVSAPPTAHAQVNIDEKKSPAQIYASDCAVCHKSIRGLANGRAKSSLAGFLSEHYTSNGQEASALAAYVLAGGGGVGTPTPPRLQPVEPGQAPAAGEEPKTREARRPAKPGEEPAENAKPPKPLGEPGKPEGEERSATAEPNLVGPERKPVPERQERAAPVRPQGHGNPANAATPKPAPARVVAMPNPVEAPKPDSSSVAAGQNAAIPTQAPADSAVPAPTDNIPD